MGPEYDFEIELLMPDGTITDTFPFWIEEDINDVIDYYKETSYDYNINLKDVEKNLMDKWYKNEIDLMTLYNYDYEFIDWIKSKYISVATDAYIEYNKGEGD